jgi:hypothetical protein
VLQAYLYIVHPLTLFNPICPKYSAGKVLNHPEILYSARSTKQTYGKGILYKIPSGLLQVLVTMMNVMQCSII